MNQQESLTFAQLGASQANWQGTGPGTARASGGTGHGAGARAAQWQSVLRPASVPLLPPPTIEAEAAAPSAAALTSALPALPSTPATQQASPFSAFVPRSASSKEVDPHGVLLVVLSVILVLLVVYLVAGPFGARVTMLQPLHNALAGMLHRG